MNAKQIEFIFKSALKFLFAGKMKLALDKSQLLIDELQNAEFTDKFNEIKQNYRFMLQYFIQGVTDPEQKLIYNSMTAKLIQMNYFLHEELLLRNSTSFEYLQKRFFPHKLHFQSTNDLFDSLTYYHSQMQFVLDKGEVTKKEKQRLRVNFEKLLPDVFAILWLSTRFSHNEKQFIRNILDEDYPGHTEKNLVISALTLNVWRMFDEDKLTLLIDACNSKNLEVQLRALIGLTFVLTRHDRLLMYFPALRNRIMILADDRRIASYLHCIIILIINTSETEGITRRMKEEILPEMMKMSPIIQDRLDKDTPLNTDEWDDEHPEWQELLSQSGIADKLKELTELQMEGADVYMSTFSMLKNFPFFNKLFCWFLPFDTNMLAISDLFEGNDQNLLNAFVYNNTICNSDKYSFCLSLLHMPASQRENISRNFKMEAVQMEELTKDETVLKPDVAARNMARQYIQDLYRFFKVHPNHAEMTDFFRYALHLHEGTYFKILSTDSDIKFQVAEYYFSKGLYSPATELYEELIVAGHNTAAMFQKLGFCYQKTAQPMQALDAYTKADILQPDDVWTVKKLALTYKITGDYSKALENYRHVDFLQPNRTSTRIQIAKCLVQLACYQEALDIYTEIELIDEGNPTLWKQICWCAFIAGKLSQAEYFNEKLLSNTPDATDLLHGGHIAFAKKIRKLALDLYLKSLNLSVNSMDSLAELINHDMVFLAAYDVKMVDIQLMIDELYFHSEKT